MEQPLDLSVTHTKNPFTIEYLTSNIYNPKQKPIFYRSQLPLNSLENKNFDLNSTINEHVVPNNSSPTISVSEFMMITIVSLFFLFHLICLRFEILRLITLWK